MEENDDYENIQLLSANEVFETYYQLLKKEMESSAATAKNGKGFNGSLSESCASDLALLAEKAQISSFSQILAELLTLLEWKNEQRTPTMQDTAIYNGLLRLEKAANNTSCWELFGPDDDGPLITVSTYEMNMLEQTVSMYLVDVLCKNISQPMFFPLTDIYKTDLLIKWRILEKIASIKVTPQQTIYKHKLTEYIKQRIQDEIAGWLDKDTKKLKLNGKTTVLKDAEMLSKVLKDLCTNITVAIDVTTKEGMLFEQASCSYFDCVSKALDEKLYPLCLQIMQSMDLYQECHKSFHVNLRDSCAVSHSLYIHLKKLVDSLRVRRKTPQTWKLDDYKNLFMKVFMNLLQVLKSECHHRIKRAIEVKTMKEKEILHPEEKILSSTVIVLNCFCTVIDEWKHLGIEDEVDLLTAFLIKIADILCDGAKIFAEALDNGLPNEGEQAKGNAHLKKVFILANSIEHVRRYLEDLPRLLQCEELIEKLDLESTEASVSTEVLRILDRIHQSMNSHLWGIIARFFHTAVSSIQSECEKYLTTWLQGSSTHQAYDRFLCCLNKQLETVHTNLKEELFPEFLSQMWMALLMQIQNEMLNGQPPEYAKTVKENVLNLSEFFSYINLEESSTHKSILQQIFYVLDLNSKTTVELQLDYFSQIAESIVSPAEYLGHIAFQAGYKNCGKDVVELYLNVQKGQRLPARKFQMEELYVKLELCPSSMFPNQEPLKSMPAADDLDNPVFNQFFQFSNLSSEVLNTKGAVVQVLVLNQDKSYSAEAVLLLNQVQNMSGFVSLEFLPVYLKPLMKFDMSQTAYQVLENRSKWDKCAKLFINSRNKHTKSHKLFRHCIPKKMTCS